MKTIIVCLFAFVVAGLAKPNEQYTNKYDGIDLEAILNNPRLVKNYIACLLEKGKCTTEGKELKSHIRDALETDCSKCTATQKAATERVIAHLLKHEVEAWNQLRQKYDSSGKYTKAHEAHLKSLAA